MTVHSFKPENAHLASPSQPLTLLARLSGRDPEILSGAPVDIQKESGGIGLALLVAAAIHWLGFVAALYVLHVPPELAVVLSTITAIGLFTIDRAAIHAFDHAASETTVRRAKATDLPGLVGWFARLMPVPLRIGFSVLTALFTGMALTLFIFEADLDARNTRLQIEIDQPFIASATDSFAAERTALVRAQREADTALARHDDAARQRADERQAQISRLEEEIERLRAEVASLRDAADRYGAEARHQRDVARCELEPDLPNCSDDVSGVAGDGPRYQSALDRAAEAEAVASAAEANLVAAQSALRGAEQRLERLLATGSSAEDFAVRAAIAATVVDAAEALGRYDAEIGGRVAAQVANDPLRRVINPESLSARLHALQLLAQEDLGVAAAMLTVKAVAFALELLTLLKLAYMKPSEYHLRRGERLVAEMVRARNSHQKRFLEEASLREAVRRKCREEANHELADDIFESAERSTRATIAPTG
jgi:hypothetical protein